jgi:hypothetical protein
VQDGPSDGGAVVVNWHPLELAGWGDAIASGDTSQLLWNPLAIADAGEGECADGYCTSAHTRRRSVYEGGGEGSRDVYDYSGKQWDQYTCNSGDQESETPESCGGQSMNSWRQHEAGTVNAEPGVQVYEDPDAQGVAARPGLRGWAQPAAGPLSDPGCVRRDVRGDRRRRAGGERSARHTRHEQRRAGQRLDGLLSRAGD